MKKDPAARNQAPRRKARDRSARPPAERSLVLPAQSKGRRRIHLSSYHYTLFVWFALLVLWCLAGAFHWVSPVLVPSPADVWRAFKNILVNGYANYSFGDHIGISFFRLLLALLLAVLAAVPLGLWSGMSGKVHALIDSVVQFYRPLPPLAYYTLLILWLGIDERSKITLLFLAAFAPLYLACTAAVRNVEQDYIHQALSLGASRRQVFFHVVLPACLPQIFLGLRTAVGAAYTTLVASEMVAATHGMGWMVIDASKYLRSDVMFVGIILMGLTGIVLDYILRAVQFWAVPYMPEMIKERQKRRQYPIRTRLKKAAAILFVISLIILTISGSGIKGGAKARTVRIGLLRVPNDEILAKASGLIEKNLAKAGADCQFMVFDSGVDANKALSSGSIDFASMGHTNGVVALANNLQVRLIWLHELLGEVEGLVVRNGSGIEQLQDLRGKRVATTFASTSHYSLLKALEAEHLDQDVSILDMQTADIVAAWKRGDIDAAYTWQPSLNELLRDGKMILSSEQMAQRGFMTANILLARSEFMANEPDLTLLFLTALREAGDLYRQNRGQALESLAEELDLSTAAVDLQTKGSQWLTAEEEISPAVMGRGSEGGRFTEAFLDTADFLKKRGFISRKIERDEVLHFIDPSIAEQLVERKNEMP